MPVIYIHDCYYDDMKTIIIILFSLSAYGMDNNPYLMKHDTMCHISVGVPLGVSVAMMARRAGAPKWLELTTAAVVPMLAGQAKERWVDKNYSGKDANSWVMAGAGAVGVCLATEWRF